MDMHSFVAKRGMRRVSLPVLSILGGLLLALQLLMPSAVFASPVDKTIPSLTQDGVLNLASVSVVRLETTYVVAKPLTTTVCTALGTIIANWPQTTPDDQNTWVLTDKSVVNLKGSTCAPVGSKLTAIKIFANTTYNTIPGGLLLGQLSCSATTCSDGTTGTGSAENFATSDTGATIFSFHSQQMQPFLTATASSAVQYSLELAASAKGASPPTPQVPGEAQVTSFLTPRIELVAGNSTGGTVGTGGLTPSLEPGTPLLDTNGALVGMQLSSNKQLTGQEILTVEGTIPLLQQPELNVRLGHNSLNTAWDRGVTQLDQKQYTQAAQSFQSIVSSHANPNFKAAQDFATRANQLAQAGKKPTNSPTTANHGGGNESFLGLPSSLLLLIAIGAGVLLIVLLLLLVSMRAGRRRVEMQQFKRDQEAAQRQAEEYMRQHEAQQAGRVTSNLQMPVSEMQCPHCHKTVLSTDTYCPNCRYLLSPSDSGLHLRAIKPQSPLSPVPQPQPQAQPMGVYAQPADQQAIADLPTVEMSPANGNNSISDEKTVPYNVQQVRGRNLSFVVGHATDPGIKRKHKPNEDSLFAMQGAKTENSHPLPFGLFVVADGMGGHANGQDASRLAIQTIVDYMVPMISNNTRYDDDGYLNLLKEGVQHANQAVHHRNMEERADMGTTMTAALVVGNTAYVANVGDSRTYLYREPEGLVKVTRDHSVVASLVDAGIIKPDDIYTHPKRNQIYRSLGEKPFVEVDTFKVPLQVGDKLLLCSDGLWDMVRDPEIQRLMSAPAPDPNKTGKALIQAALDGGGEDNVSVIVIYINEMSSQPTISNVQLIAKPENVTLPELPLPGA